MKFCPITYAIVSSQADYSQQGLQLLSPQLKQLHPLTLSAVEQRMAAVEYMGKMSIQGVQPKLSAILKIKEGCFKIVDTNGRYILKPQSEYYPEVPENEALTMTLAEIFGIEVPVHGLVYSKDKSKTYFIKRFDRIGHNQKLAVEDFSQLLGLDRETKYESSMEKVIWVVSTYCSFPKIEFVKLFKRTLFNFLVGNEDMHLKNFSLITRQDRVALSPADDLLNSTIVQKNSKEEIALPLNGKKNNLTQKDLLVYFAAEKLGLNNGTIQEVIQEVQHAIPLWKSLIGRSGLSKGMQEKYLKLLDARCRRIL